MTTHHFSIKANPALFLEILNPASPTSAPTRPAAGVPIKVRLYRDQTACPDTATLDGGYLDFAVDDAADVLAVEISANDGTDWSGPFWSTESEESAMQSGTLAQSASDAVTTLTDTVEEQGTTLSSVVDDRLPAVETKASAAKTTADTALSTAQTALNQGGSGRIRLVAVDGEYEAKDSTADERDYIGAAEPPIGGLYASGTDLWFRTGE